MRIVEQFSTLQCEGKYLGVPSYFIRTTGCNLRCQWQNKDGTTTKCDTPYTSWNLEIGYNLDLTKTIQELNQNLQIEHIVITGGEPTLQKDLKDVCLFFWMHGFQVTIETNGTKFIEDLEPHCFLSISPKLKSSYGQDKDSKEAKIHKRNNRSLKKTLFQLTQSYPNHQIKFVYNCKEDMKGINSLIMNCHLDKSKIYLMPQGTSKEQLGEKEKELFDICIREGYNFTPRLHINIFGNKRGI